ncbi:hypothetical protein V8C86DRAFT_3132596 [Haematococcus lacustris]
MEPPSAQQRAVPAQQINALALPSAVFELITSEAIRAGDGPNLNQASKACRIACLRTIGNLSLNIDDMSYSGFLTHDNVMALRGRGLPMTLTLWQRRTHIDMKSRYLVEGAIGQLGHCPAIRLVRIVAGDYPYVDLNVDTWLAAKMMPNFPNVEHLVVEGTKMPDSTYTVSGGSIGDDDDQCRSDNDFEIPQFNPTQARLAAATLDGEMR